MRTIDLRSVIGLTKHPRVALLEETQGPKWCWGLVKLWDTALSHYPDGTFHNLTEDQVAKIAGWGTHKKEYIGTMIELHWLKRTPAGDLALLDWESRVLGSDTGGEPVAFGRLIDQNESINRPKQEGIPAETGRFSPPGSGTSPSTSQPSGEPVTSGRLIDQNGSINRPKQIDSTPKTPVPTPVQAEVLPKNATIYIPIVSSIPTKKVPTANDILAATRSTFEEKIKTKDDRELFLGTLVETLKDVKIPTESWTKSFSEEIRTKIMPRTKPASFANDRWTSWLETVNDEIEIARGRFLSIETVAPVSFGTMTAEDLGNIRAQQVIDGEVRRLRAAGKIK